jgi:excinuclease UvrABC nuclease subunit
MADVCGIYCIRNRITGDCYVGKSVHIRSRLKTHFEHLEERRHHCKGLQKSYEQHGHDAFESLELEQCAPEDLSVKEAEWMIRLRPALNTYIPNFEVFPNLPPTPQDLAVKKRLERHPRKLCLRCRRAPKRKGELFCSGCREQQVEELQERGYFACDGLPEWEQVERPKTGQKPRYLLTGGYFSRLY